MYFDNHRCLEFDHKKIVESFVINKDYLSYYKELQDINNCVKEPEIWFDTSQKTTKIFKKIIIRH